MNQKYQSILDLERKLAKANIPRIFQKWFDGYQIIYIDQNGNRIGDVIQCMGSYGLEAAGFDRELSEVNGYLSYTEAFKLFKDAHEKDLQERKICNAL